MRFPLRFAAKLAKSQVLRGWRKTQSSPLLTFADPAEVLHSGSEHPISHEKMCAILFSPTPFLWVGGTEPLKHPGIAHFVRFLLSGRHYLFLETDGMALRRRIHEFEPRPRLFLTVRLDARRNPEFDLAVEGLRAARLSGFFIAVHSLVHENSDVAKLNRLRALLLEMDVDGWMITAASTDQPALAQAAEARSLIPSAGWRRFSVEVERTLFAQAKSRESHGVCVAEKPHAEPCEEGVNAA